VYRRRWSISASLQEGDASRRCCVTKTCFFLSGTWFDYCDAGDFRSPETLTSSSKLSLE